MSGKIFIGLGLILQTIIMFIVGLVLLSYGLPSSTEEVAIDFGEKILEEEKKTPLGQNEVSAQILDDGSKAIRILGKGFIIASILETVLLIASGIITIMRG